MSNKYDKVNITTWSPLLQVLIKSHMNLGSLVEEKVEILDFKTFKRKFVTIIPGKLKLVLEPLDNSIEENVRTNGEFGDKLRFDINKKYFKIVDNGRGIPIEEKQKDLKKLGCVNAFTRMGSSGNYLGSDGKEVTRTGASVNGVGVALTALFSEEFTVINTDYYSKESVKIETVNHKPSKLKEMALNPKKYPDFDPMSFNELPVKVTKLNKSTNHGVALKAKIDFKMFDQDEFTEDDIEYLKYYLTMQGIINDIDVTFNGESLPKITKKQLITKLHKSAKVFEGKNYIFGLWGSDHQYSYSIINSLIGIQSSMADYILKEVASALRVLINEDNPELNITLNQVRNMLGLYLIVNKFPNLQFEGNSKTSVKNNTAECRKYFNISKDSFYIIADKLLGDKVIRQKIEDFINAKDKQAEMENKRKLDSEIRNVKVAPKKYRPAVKEKRNLFLVEGDSAGGAISNVVPPDYNGVLKLQGKITNVVRTDIIFEKERGKKINTDIMNIFNTLGIGLSEPIDAKKLKYKKVILAMDADDDGIHIITLVTALFGKHAKGILQEGILYRLITPLYGVDDSNGKVIAHFATLEEFDKFKNSGQMKRGMHIEYFKGLATLREQDWVFLFKTKKLEDLITKLTYKDLSKGARKLIDALGEDTSYRKQIVTNKYKVEYV